MMRRGRRWAGVGADPIDMGMGGRSRSRRVRRVPAGDHPCHRSEDPGTQAHSVTKACIWVCWNAYDRRSVAAGQVSGYDRSRRSLATWPVVVVLRDDDLSVFTDLSGVDPPGFTPLCRLAIHLLLPVGTFRPSTPRGRDCDSSGNAQPWASRNVASFSGLSGDTDDAEAGSGEIAQIVAKITKPAWHPGVEAAG